MTRQLVIESLLRMLRPLGPTGDPDQREEEEVAWATRAASDPVLMVALFDLVRNPATSDERGRVAEPTFQSQLAHVLAFIGARASTTVLNEIGPLTQDSRSRATAIEVIGAIGDPAGLHWLQPLINVRDLSDDEAGWLACALGDIGTPEAATLLERLWAQTPPDRVSVHREIEIARDAIARDSSA